MNKLKERKERKEAKNFNGTYYDVLGPENDLVSKQEQHEMKKEIPFVVEPSVKTEMNVSRPTKSPYENNPNISKDRKNSIITSTDIYIVPDTLKHIEHIGHNNSKVIFKLIVFLLKNFMYYFG